MKIRKRYDFQIWILALVTLTTSQAKEEIGEKHSHKKDGKSSKLFSPRMDYEQWTPLGRGDPLKNDPTYDYVPPVLDRVHYWMDPSRKSEDKKTEILVLGVSSKKPSNTKIENRRDQVDPYIQMVEQGMNYNRRTFPFYQFFQNQNSDFERQEPLTILVPPPMELGETSYQTQMSSIQTTTSVPTSVSIDSSKLVFQSSSISGDWKGSNTYATIAEPSSLVTWRTPLNSTDIIVNSGTTNVEDIVVVPHQVPIHKGQVTDVEIDPSNSFVNIGKTETKIQPSEDLDPKVVLPKETLMPPEKNAPMTFGPSLFMVPMSKNENMRPMTLQMTMQTVLPTTQNLKKNNFLQNLLNKETTPFLPTTLSPIYTTSTTTRPTTTASTTTPNSLTTDPLFRHYKQPAEPLKGPLYLIIQGHSKVKTYGPAKQMNGINVQETNEILTDDSLTDYPVKHLHMTEKKEEWHRQSRNQNLQTLDHVIKTNLGAHQFSSDKKNDSSNGKDVKVTEFVVKYDVSNDKETTSEVYKKGIVENEKAPQRENVFLFNFVKKHK